MKIKLSFRRIWIFWLKGFKWTNKSIGGDLNGHVSKDSDGFEQVHWGYGYYIRNDEDKAILEFALAYDLVVANTYFKKRDSCLVANKRGKG